MTMTRICFSLVLFFVACAYSQQWNGRVPAVSEKYAAAAKNFREYRVILEPDKNEPEWWAGAPSVVRDSSGTFWLAARMRTAHSPRGLRGYEIRILKSDDGINFHKVRSIKREDVPIPGFERPALVIDPRTKKFKLYGCGPWQEGPWSIIKFDDADSPDQFVPSSARPVIQPIAKRYDRDIVVTEYKDPFVIYAEGEFHCYVTGYIRRNERLFHFKSPDGENWGAVGEINQPVMDLSGWHNFFIRPASVLPLGIGYLFIYEGSSTNWYDPVYNLGTGFGFTFDLHHVTELTVESPIAVSTTPGKFHIFRYSHWMWVDGEIWVYAEVARANDSIEIRLFRISIN